MNEDEQSEKPFLILKSVDLPQKNIRNTFIFTLIVGTLGFFFFGALSHTISWVILESKMPSISYFTFGTVDIILLIAIGLIFYLFIPYRFYKSISSPRITPEYRFYEHKIETISNLPIPNSGVISKQIIRVGVITSITTHIPSNCDSCAGPISISGLGIDLESSNTESTTKRFGLFKFEALSSVSFRIVLQAIENPEQYVRILEEKYMKLDRK